jgi:hypothetical protein
VSLAVFALVVAIWVVLLVPIARRGRAELAAEASEGTSRLRSGGARPWTSGNLPVEPGDEGLEAVRRARRRAVAGRQRRQAAARRRRRVLLLLVVATAAGSRAWVVLGGRWWLAAAAAGLLLAGYLLALVALGRARVAGVRPSPARRGRWAAAPAAWGGQLPLSTE